MTRSRTAERGHAMFETNCFAILRTSQADQGTLVLAQVFPRRNRGR
jgi:hypothetical protein